MAKRVGVVLAGCGVFDGSEIHETVITLLALDRAGASVVACAPDLPQMHVIDHFTGTTDEKGRRNVLAESARLVRGQVRDVARVRTEEVDALVVPGGFGVAKNLCDFATRGRDCSAQPDVARLVREVHAEGKPVCALCIAPALLARVLGDEHPDLTIGDDASTAAALEAMGARHHSCTVNDIVVDRERRLVTTPAYMLGRRISEVATGIEKAIAATLEMA